MNGENKMPKKLMICFGTFIAAIALLWSALILTSLIPNEAIRKNMEKNVEYYNGIDPFYQSGSRSSITDNYADVILLNVMWNIKSDDPIVSSLDTKYYDGNDGINDYGENYGFYAALNGAEPNTDYSRYWHGSTVFLRPLMLITDVNGIKLIGAFSALILLVLDCVLLFKKKQRFAAAALPVSFVLVRMWNIRLALEYQPVVLICLTMIPLFVIFENKGDLALAVLSVISGAMTAFFDFLTAETLTILIPLIIIMIMRRENDSFRGFRSELMTSVKCGLAWLFSYAGAFIAKWALASAFTGENKFMAAISSAEERIYGEAENTPAALQILLAPLANLSALFGGSERISPANIIAGLLITFLIFGGLYLITRSGRNGNGFAPLMLIIGLLPYLRYIVLNNHSYLHDFFTYRAQAASVLALLAAIWYCSEFAVKAVPTAKKQHKGRRR